MRSLKLIAIGASGICASGAALAGQSFSYTYDELGRLTLVQIQSGPGSGTSENYQYDPVGNRTLYQVSGVTALTPISLSVNSPVVNMTVSGEIVTLSVGATAATGTVDLMENGVYLGSAWVTAGFRVMGPA